MSVAFKNALVDEDWGRDFCSWKVDCPIEMSFDFLVRELRRTYIVDVSVKNTSGDHYDVHHAYTATKFVRGKMRGITSSLSTNCRSKPYIYVSGKIDELYIKTIRDIVYKKEKEIAHRNLREEQNNRFKILIAKYTIDLKEHAARLNVKSNLL